MKSIVLVLCIIIVICSQEQSYDNQSLTFLQRINTASIDDSQRNHSEVSYTEKEDKHIVFYFHKWSNFLIWGIIVDIGLLFNRYGVFLKYRLEIHSIIMGLCVLPTVIADILMSLIWNPPKFYGKEELAYWHRAIGFAYLLLMVLQCAGGLTLKIFIQSQKKSTTIKLQQLLHIYVGYFMYIIGKIQCGIGFYEVYNDNVDQGRGNLLGFWITYAIIFLWRCIFEIFYQNGVLYDLICKPKIINSTHTIQDTLLIQYILQNDTKSICKEFPYKMWFIFNNDIIDLTGFVHPGGQFMWEKTKGREISRFIYGTQGLEDGSTKPYQHSMKAIQIIQQHKIGKLNNLQYIFRPNSIIEESNSNLWKLKTITQFTDRISYFGFENSQSNTISQLTNFNQFGRYYQIKSYSNNRIPIRQYTCVISMAPENVEYRNSLIKYFEKKIINNEEYQVPVQPKFLKALPLIIKKYESKTGFSNYIHSHINEIYDIQGPFGPSLGIPNNGKIAIICGGTGILPFLDFLDFFLKSLIFQVVLKKYGQNNADILNQHDCLFLENNIHVTLVLAVATKQELIGQDIYLALVALQKLITKSCFKLVLKVKDQGTTNNRFDKEFILKHLSNFKEFKKIFICGPAPMVKSVPQTLQSLGIQEENIIFI